MQRITSAYRADRGMTLIELMVVIAIIGILVGLASLSADFIRREDVNKEIRQILADIQRARADAMTKGPSDANPEVRGFGIKFTPPTSYSIFMFDDKDRNWQYTDVGEEVDPKRQRNIRNTITFGAVDASNNSVDIVIFDRYGYVHRKDWTTIDNVNIYLRHSSLGDSYRKCVTIQTTKIREGFWNGTSCAEQ